MAKPQSKIIDGKNVAASMISADEVDVTLQKTPRRAAREGYCRFLLDRANYTDDEIDEFLLAKQEQLFGCSPYELIYTGRYDMAVTAVEALVESLEE